MSTSDYKDVGEVKDLIQALNSGVEFYEDARNEVTDNMLIAIFDDVITSHKKCASKLQTLVVAEDGKAETGSDWGVKLRELYTKATASMKSDKDLGYVSQLEEVEDKLLEKCDEAITSNRYPMGNSVLHEVRSEILFCHNRIRQIEKARKQQTA